VALSYEAGFQGFRDAIQPRLPLGVPHELLLGQRVRNDDPAHHNVVITYGYVLARAAGGSSTVSILDWGGGLGNYYLLSRTLLPEVELDYHCTELPRIVSAGRQPLARGALADPGRLGGRAQRPPRHFNSLDQHFAAFQAEPGVSVQLHAVSSLGLRASTPLSLQGRPDEKRGQELHLALEREFISDDGWTAPGAPGEVKGRSYMFSRVS
jgi:hypothetical protein